MATRREVFFIRDSTGALVDSGGALAWAQFAIRNSDGTLASSSGPSFTDRGTGIAEFEVTLTSGQYAYGEVTITSPGVGPITYGPVTYADLLTPATSSDVPSASTIATQVDTTLSGTHGSGAWGGAAGDGARTVTVTVTGVVGARVVAYLSGTAQGAAYTNGSGDATLYLDDGTYALQVTAPGYNASTTALVVDGAESVTVGLTAITSESTSPVGLTGTIDCEAKTLVGEISGIVAGDSITIRRTITSVPDTITKAWLTIKDAKDAPNPDAKSAIVQLEITSASSSAGQITDTGADGTAAVTFTLTASQSARLSRALAYDIQILAGSSVKTPEVGVITATAGITTTTA